MQHMRTQGSLSPALHKLNWGQNWTLEDFNTAAIDDSFYQKIQSSVESIYTIGTDQKLTEEQQLNASRVAAQLSNFARGNNPLAGELRRMLKWSGIEDQSFMIGGLNEFYNMMGDETFNRQARRDLYTNLSDVIGDKGRLRGVYGFEETGQLVSDFARHGLLDVTALTRDELKTRELRRAQEAQGMYVGDDFGLSIQQLNLNDGMDKAETDKLGKLIEEQLDNFRAIKEMGERYGIEVRDLVVSMQNMTGGKLGTMLNRMDPNRLADQTSQLFEAGRLAGFGFVETGQFTASVAASMMAEGMDPSGAIGMARRSLTDTAAAMQRGGGAQAGRQEHVQAALNRQMTILGSQPGKLAGFAIELEKTGLLPQGFVEAAYADGGMLTEGQLMEAMQAAGHTEATARAMFDDKRMGMLAGRHSEQILEMLMMDPKSPLSAVTGFKQRAFATGVFDNETQYNKFREFASNVRGEDSIEQYRMWLKETGGNLAKFDSSFEGVRDYITGGYNFASNADFWQHYQMVLGGESASDIRQSVVARATLNRVLQERFKDDPDIKFGQGFVGVLEHLSSAVERGDKVTVAALGSALAGMDLDKAMGALGREKDYLGSEQGFMDLVKQFEDQGMEDDEARAAAERAQDLGIETIEEIETVFSEDRDKVEKAKALAEAQAALKAEGEGVTQGGIAQLFDELKTFLADLPLTISGNLTLTDDGAYIETKSNKATAEADAKNPEGVTKG
jgi:hypothetical protein